MPNQKPGIASLGSPKETGLNGSIHLPLINAMHHLLTQILHKVSAALVMFRVVAGPYLLVAAGDGHTAADLLQPLGWQCSSPPLRVSPWPHSMGVRVRHRIRCWCQPVPTTPCV